MNLLRILVVLAVLVAVISAFMSPANAQVYVGSYLLSDSQYENDAGARTYEPPLTDLPERWMRSGGTPIFHSDSQKGKSRLRSIFHNGGATSVPEGSECEACH